MEAPKAAGPAPAIAGRGAAFVEQLPGRLDDSAIPEPQSPQAPLLREYQARAVQDLRAAFRGGASGVAFQLPTGGGKTVILAEIIRKVAANGGRVLVLVHRCELLEQTSRALALLGIAHGMIAPGAPATADAVQIAMVATFNRRLETSRDRFALVVVDECHHAVAGSWAAVLASQPRARVLGVTATPERLDGRGLGERFEALIVGPSVAELIAAGFLAPFIVYEPARPNLDGAKMRGGDFAAEDLRNRMGGLVIGAAVAEYRRLCSGAPAIAFCVDRKHSEDVATVFVAAGFRARHLDGDTPPAERRATIADLAGGRLDVITNCGLISEGLDVPNVAAVLMLRPTASSALFLQQTGRALRPAPGKARAIILDFAGNCARHGLPDAPRAWSLDSRPRRQRDKGDAPPLRRCPSCSALNPPGAFECEECAADLRTPRERREIELQLAEARRREEEDFVASLPRHAAIAWAGADPERLRLVARLQGFKPGWAFYQRERALAARGDAPR